MKITRNKIVQNWIIIFVIMVAGFVLIGFYILVCGNQLASQATESFYAFNLKDKKNAARVEVSNRLDEINFERRKLLDAEKSKLYNKIKHIAFHLQISLDNYDTTSPEQTQRVIKEYERLVSEDKEHLYFAINSEGVVMRSGTDEKLVESNLYNVKDSTGNYFVQEIIKAENEPDGIFVSYYWPKEKGGEAKKKTSYCLYLPKLNLIIGTGVYHDDLQSQLQKKIYERLQSYYEEKDNYIFVVEYDSTLRVTAQPDLIGKKVSEHAPLDALPVHEQFMKLLSKADDGYHSYHYSKKNSTVLAPKTAYIHKLEDWNAYIGTGFYLDELQAEVDNYSRLFKEHYHKQALIIISSLFLLSLIVFVLFRRGVNLQKKALLQGDIIYKKLFELSHDAIVVTATDNQLLYENEIAAKLFSHQTASFFNSEHLRFQEVNSNIYSFDRENGAGRRHYIRIRKQSAIYKQKNSTIYFISDITKQYIESHALEKMAYIDELTGLPNRRVLRDDYDEMTEKVDESTTCIIGILDIDKFKCINDSYGHHIGDLVLQLLSRVFTNRLRQNDAVFRYGGEEFVFLLNNVSLRQAKEIIEGINRQFCELTKQEQGVNCTFSCGMVLINSLNKDKALDKQILLADQLLYKAKENGRNRIEI